MPNRFTTALDSCVNPDEEDRTTGACFQMAFFDTIFGEWPEEDKFPAAQQLSNWRTLAQLKYNNKHDTLLFWAFIAELSDEDLAECFPEIQWPDAPLGIAK